MKFERLNVPDWPLPDLVAFNRRVHERINPLWRRRWVRWITWMFAGLFALVAPQAELDAAVDRWVCDHLAARSAAVLRCAAQASRLWLAQQVEATLPHLERLYLDTLMLTRDANEGIDAFLGKRQPQWVHA